MYIELLTCPHCDGVMIDYYQCIDCGYVVPEDGEEA
jgi:hypothetical protein